MEWIRSKRAARKAKFKSAEIDREIAQDHQIRMRLVKLLFLGDAESVQRIFTEKMILHDNLSVQERINFKPLIFLNLVRYMRNVVRAMTSLHISYGTPDRAKDGEKILKPLSNLEDGNLLEMPADVGQSVKALWADSGIQECYRRSREYQLSEMAGYFFENLHRICEQSYIPSHPDVIRIRTKARGLTESAFELQNLNYCFINVSGLQSNHKKWTHCFEDVTAIAFCADLCCYDQFSKDGTNLMLNCLKRFETVCNDKFLSNTSILLFLDNKDKFEEKIMTYSLSNCFPEYNGIDNYEEAAEYIQLKFEEQNKCPNDKEIITHFTCETDMAKVQFLITNAKNVILAENLWKHDLL